MRIGFNARSLAAPQIRGWTRYTLELLRHLPALGSELVLFSDQALNPEYLALLEPGSFKVVQSPPMRYLAWEQGWLALACARERVDILHAPANYGLPLLARCPRVLTLHDAIDLAFAAPGARARRSLRVSASFWAARHAASRVITVSEHAKRDLGRYFSIPSRKISVIHEASELIERAPSAAEEQRLLDELGVREPFVLYAGGFEARKNVGFLLDSFRAASLEGTSLVLVGSSPPQALRSETSLSQAVHWTGFVPDATLAALYRRALVFVYPSLYEGFGLQLCEAMSFGCPTLAANATSLPEVLGYGGDTFSPTNQEALVGLLRRVRTDSAYRSDLVARATRRALDFSWQQTAKATYEVYRSCT